MTFSIHVAGWTLVHFVWQGALVGLAAGAAVRLLGSASARTRYGVACGALAVMLASPIITARLLSKSDLVISPSGRSERVSFAAAGALAPFAAPRPPQHGVAAQTGSRGVEALLPLVVMAWLVGVAFLLLRLAGGWWCVRRLHREALAMASSRWQTLSELIASRLCLHRGVHVVDSQFVDTPTALGWLRPVVLLPLAALTNLTPTQIEAILAHELAHVRRHDYLVNLLQTVAETLLFYHPAVWWVSARIRAEREHCCDDVAVEVSGDALSYVAALAEIEAWRTSPAGRTEQTALAPAATGGSLLDRVRRILRVPVDNERSSSSALLTTAMALLLIIVAGGRQHLPALAYTRSAATQSLAPDAVRAAFEVASVKPVTRDVLLQGGFGCGFRGARFRALGPGRWLIACAYGIPAARADQQIFGSPDWLNIDLFEIIANSAPDNVPRSFSEGLVMLRTLLADRFKLAVHRETKEMPTYALVMARADGRRGPQLRPTPQDCAAWIAARGRPGPQPSTPGYRLCGFGRVNRSTITNTAMPLSRFADFLSPRVGRVVRDRTGLTGYFDLDLQYTPEPVALGSPVERGPSLFTALQDQLGLKLEPTNDSVDLLVIDHVEHPTAN
jgi:uncharacterized protein (TIGR03435 family)